MITEVITKYLADNRRLVIPQIGAFFVKEPGHRILFSELMKGDDGVLRGALEAEGMNEIEAAGAVNRLVFDIRHAIQVGQPFTIEGLGSLTTNATGGVVFTQQAARTVAKRHNTADTTPNTSESEQDAEPIRTHKASKSTKIDPDPDLKGLRYRKPRKIHSYNYYTTKKENKIDKLVVIAIIAAVLSIFAIAYGYYTSSHRVPLDTETVVNTDSISNTEATKK